MSLTDAFITPAEAVHMLAWLPSIDDVSNASNSSTSAVQELQEFRDQFLRVANSRTMACPSPNCCTHNGRTHHATCDGATQDGAMHTMCDSATQTTQDDMTCDGATHDGTMHDGATHDGTMHNGTMHNGSTHNGTMQDDTAHDGTTHTMQDGACQHGGTKSKHTSTATRQHNKQRRIGKDSAMQTCFSVSKGPICDDTGPALQKAEEFLNNLTKQNRAQPGHPAYESWVMQKADFTAAVNQMQLAVKVNSMIYNHGVENGSKGTLYVTDIHQQLVMTGGAQKPAARTFKRWTDHGMCYARLAAAGSIYAVMLVAAYEQRTDFQALFTHEVDVLCNHIRQPDKGTQIGKMIISHLIPVIASLHMQIPLQFDAIFSSHLTELGLPLIIGGHDLVMTDTFFETFQYNDFTPLPRDREVWASCLVPIDGMPADMATLNSVLADATVDDKDVEAEPRCSEIRTPFNPRHPINRAYPWPSDDAKRMFFDIHHRKFAGRAVVPQSLDEFQRIHAAMFDKEGVKVLPGEYVKLPQELISRARTKLKCDDDSLLAYIDGTMPKKLCEALAEMVVACFAVDDTDEEGVLKDIDTSQNPGLQPPSFKALYFDFYNRMAPKGDNALQDVHPNHLKTNSSRVNRTQFVPLAATDMHNHQ
ncbi:hypothetical protein FISHEDRAFT_63139 [Fistulina hepatica ATCC 64428]|uniref:Uncharacterized protein n=1 Tax=Fistulina hepatica ATCC 64428 TaxID=1128425 RepID=A0A0D6ZZ97_9AGAR|nr:hypothetical protein FISHEDRAFT_63139 [Fistulina hepatica ATCC 64428]